MATLALSDYPFGVSLLNMEYLSPQVEVSQINEIFYRKNSNDGTSILFKTIAEFGYFGVVFSLFGFYLFAKYLKSGMIFAAILLFGFVVATIRGTSYFDGVQLLAISAIIVYFFNKSRLKTHDTSPAESVSRPPVPPIVG